MFHKGMIIILDSRFCILRAIIELKKTVVYASAFIKKCKYWPKYIDGDSIKAHSKGKEVGSVDSLPGKMHDIPFHIFVMKKPDYMMKLMSTYGTNELQLDHLLRRTYIPIIKKVTKDFHYPEIVSNHFKYRHTIDDHITKRHSPICLEYV